MTAADQFSLAARLTPPAVIGGRRAARLFERNALSYRRMWPAFLSGMFEPMLYLFSLSLGLGALVGKVEGPGGAVLDYADFVAPGMLAAAAMNGSIIDATFGLFYKLNYAKTYEAVLATPLDIDDIAYGELSWSMFRGAVYAATFVVVMALHGSISSLWGVLVWPAAMLVAFAFSAAGMAATTFMRGWQDFDYVQLLLMPLFLFSATFYPVTTYPPGLRAVVWCSPLFHGVELIRALSVGAVGPVLAVHAGVLFAVAALGITIVRRRLRVRLLR